MELLLRILEPLKSEVTADSRRVPSALNAVFSFLREPELSACGEAAALGC